MKKKLRVTVEGKTYEVEVEEVGTQAGTTFINKSNETASKPSVAEPAPQQSSQPKTTDGEVVRAPIPGKVWKIVAQVGEPVNAGDVLLILEAMKMENEIIAPCDGELKEILVSEGKTVNTGDALVVIA